MLAIALHSSLPFPSTLDRAGRISALKSIKNRSIGKRERKLELLRKGDATILVAMLAAVKKELSLHERAEYGEDCGVVYSDEAVAELTEIVTILGTLSLSTPEAAHILLLAKIFSPLHDLSDDICYDRGFLCRTELGPNHLRLQEAVTRSLRNHCVDLVKVVGPQFWGNWILGETDSGDDEIEELLAGEGGISSEAMVEVRHLAEELFGRALSVTPELSDPEFVPHVFDLLHAFADISWNHGHGVEDTAPRVVKPIVRLRMVELILDFIGGTFYDLKASHVTGWAFLEPSVSHFCAVRRVIALTRGSVQESAVKAMSALIRRYPTLIAAHEIINTPLGLPAISDAISELTRSSIPSLSIAAATCRTILWKASKFGSVKSLLPLLLNAMEQDSTHNAEAAFTFAYLISGDEELQAQALLLKCLPRIHVLLTTTTLSTNPYTSHQTHKTLTQFHSALFLSLAALTSTNESHRKQFIDEPSLNLLSLVVQNLRHYDSKIKLAALFCLRGLSRSVGILRTKLVEIGAAGILLGLLGPEEGRGVRTVVLAIIGNLLIDFSPLKSPLIAGGCLPLIIDAVKSDYSPLRINALWALKNVIYASSSAFKNELANALGWDLLSQAISDENTEIIIPALGILRNIVCGFGESVAPLLAQRGASMVDLLEDKIISDEDEISLQAIYCLVNLATAGSGSKEAIVSSEITLLHIMERLDYANAEIRCAAVWVIVNLVFTPPHSRRANETMTKLRQLGFALKLRMMSSAEPSLNVRERISDALTHFD